MTNHLEGNLPNERDDLENQRMRRNNKPSFGKCVTKRNDDDIKQMKPCKCMI